MIRVVGDRSGRLAGWSTVESDRFGTVGITSAARRAAVEAPMTRRSQRFAGHPA
ncbi:hypothetical protein [Nocardia wallacei]|uniref:hypothetical protein n=1 Tax=Nocardia wallacei TaxID=480035 RepID=UPI002454F7D2|nr:hypothetical protein [Nocardia wallacei]